jgi:hypothetical protein
MYVEYEFYTSLYGTDAIKEAEFNRLSWEACKKVDYHTTGVDGLKKLKHFFPVYEEDAEAVKRCVCKLIDVMQKVNLAEDASGYVVREDGTLQGKLVASVSAGNESISYSAGKNAINIAANDSAAREKLYMDIITEYLSGVTDSNGVNLLYMGVYPRRVI